VSRLKTPKIHGEGSYDVITMPTKLANEIWPMIILLLGTKMQFYTFWLKIKINRIVFKIL